jgi:hypothetical protein
MRGTVYGIGTAEGGREKSTSQLQRSLQKWLLVKQKLGMVMRADNNIFELEKLN